ncbi:multicopper oxidase domain-containing protein [Pontibacter mangrovi]|uniref:Copper oxidase n=2 Tax=Pseudomonadati TaxID=3379134 RepID=A0A501WNV5_9RHOB|nr:multicopper oxidase domain-containing protein [Pontibacter mangrovi]TPE41512.1 copper oxidase [Pontibacter mangrovi]TPE48701.1 copper oxidase [Amaricoccus solimangrovi]
MIIHLALTQKEAAAQTDTIVYNLTIDQQQVKIAGKKSMGMTINGSIPGPTLRFKIGDYAVIRVTNKMPKETSIHWHGILLPNFFDGVPYLTTPPVEPGTTFTYEFELKHTGTYWYHSHTGLQEQMGVYGSIVVEDREQKLDYDSDLVVVLSDWTYEKPTNVLKTLKRGLEIYDIQKGTSIPLSMVIARGALGAQLNFWKQRMEGADIADIYYPAFLTNGQPVREYPEYKPGQKVRLRVINAAASSQFWLTFGGDTPLLVAADGPDVVPVKRDKTFIAVAETYDFIVTIPQNGKLEMKATVQDGSGHTSALLGQGPVIPAPDVPRPDKIAMMQQMAAMSMKMGAPATKFNPSEEEPYEMMKEWGMQMDDEMQMGEGMHMEHGKSMDQMDMKQPEKKQKPMQHNMEMKQDTTGAKKIDHSKMEHQRMPKDTTAAKGMDHTKMNHTMHSREMRQDSAVAMEMDHAKMNHRMHEQDVDTAKANSIKERKSIGMQHEGMPGMEMFAEYNYDYLKAPESTDFAEDKPVREILLNLTGNMVRYIWSMNGVPLKEADKIKINQGEVTRITLNNLTMMHHPMHLHGHFFRVINEHGEYSPLKHTVNVAPMQKVVIEFDANEYGDWFFHCHILYHLDAGMARIFSYDTPRDPRLKGYPLNILTNKSNHFFFWGAVDAASHMSETRMVLSNLRNQFTLTAEYGWNKNLEAELTYGRFLYDYLNVFVGVNVENEQEDSMDEVETTAITGIRWLTPYMFNLDLRMDNKLRPQISLGREVLIFPRTFLFGEYEYQADFGWVNDFEPEEGTGKVDSYRSETTWNVGLEYLMSKSFSLMGSYDNRFGAGGGLTVRF